MQDAFTETYIKVKGEWNYYYRAADKEGNMIDFLLTATHDKKATLRFLNKAIGENVKPGPNCDSTLIRQVHAC